MDRMLAAAVLLACLPLRGAAVAGLDADERSVALQSPGLLPADTVWLNATAQCTNSTVCVVAAQDRWLFSGNLTVDGLDIQGVFKWDDTVPGSVLSVGWILVEKGGIFQVGSVAQPIGRNPGVQALIYFRSGVANRHPTYGDRFLIGDGSNIVIQGLPKARTWSVLSRPATKGATELFLRDDPVAMGWRVGDEVGVATTNTDGGMMSSRHRIVAIRPATDERIKLVGATAGIQEAPLPAANAIDGNVGSLWSSFLGNATQLWLVVDLASNTDVTHMQIYFTEPRYAPVFTIAVQSYKGGPWVNATTVTNGHNGWQDILINMPNVSSVRFYADYNSLVNRGYKGLPGTEPAWSGLWVNEVYVFGRKVGVPMPTVIVLDTPLDHDRMGGITNVAGYNLELAAEVINLQRSVLLTGDHDDFYVSLTGFHTAMMNRGVIDVRYARVEFCGQRDKMGRYCMHMHQLSVCPDCAFVGNAVVDSQQVGMTIHSTHKALIDQNTMFDCRAVGIYIEDGNEMNNTISNNVLICSWWEKCAVPWQNRDALHNGGMYVIGMTNHFLYNRVIGYQHGTWTVGGVYPNGQGFAWGKVCPQFQPFLTFRGNVHHDCQRFGIYLDNQYPRNLVRDAEGYVVSGCQPFKEDGSDNGASPAVLIEDAMEWHNMFQGQYSSGDLAYVRLTSVNCWHSMYWKTSKNFADGVSYHVKDSLILNDNKDPQGRLNFYGPSGPFTFKLKNVTFAGGPVGEAALNAGQHCGLGGAGGPCDVQYQLEDIHWERLMPWQKKLNFGVNAANIGFVQPIVLAKDSYSLDGMTTLVSQYLNGFEKLGCVKQSWVYDNAYSCNFTVRRLNFWTTVDQGNLTLSGPGYDVAPNWAEPVNGHNAGIIPYEPMHRGYGMPVVAGGTYTVNATWRGDVFVEFSDQVLDQAFNQANALYLSTADGTVCNLTSSDPRSFLSALGLSGQGSTKQLEDALACTIRGQSPSTTSTPSTATTTAKPAGRTYGQCQFSNPPGIGYQWNPACAFGGLGCMADGKNPECAFCGSPPFLNCTANNVSTTATTTSAATSTTTTVTGRPYGQCQFPNPPVGIGYQWDANCIRGGVGCMADGKNAECAFCGVPPFPNCTKNNVTWTGTTTPATTTTAVTTTKVVLAEKEAQVHGAVATSEEAPAAEVPDEDGSSPSTGGGPATGTTTSDRRRRRSISAQPGYATAKPFQWLGLPTEEPAAQVTSE